MPVIEAHFFAPDDLNGSTIFECSSDDRFVKNIHLDIQRDKLGAGTIEFARRVPAGGLFTREIVVPEVFVRYLVPSIDATHYLWGNFIGPRQQQVVSKAESGGEGFKFGGPGPKFYLTRMILWSASFSGQDNAVDRQSGVWKWPETASAGRIMARLIEEETDNPHGPFLPDLTASFGDVNDSDGVPWTDDVSGTDDFTLNIQDDYLKILWALENAGELISNMNLGTVSNPLMQLGMYQSLGRDLTGAIAADTVHFTEGVNISSDLDVEGESLKKGTHALVQGDEGIYHFVASPDFVPGEYKKVIPVDYSSSANTNTLDRAGKRALRRQRGQEHGIELRIVPGFDPANGLYMPGFEGTDGHFWLSDTVDLTTGIAPNQTELDYDDEPQLVTGIELELAKAVKDGSDLEAARSFDVTVHLNKDRTNDSTTPSGGKGGGSPAGSANCNCLRLCRPVTVDAGTNERLYFINTAGTPRTAAASWTGGSSDMVTRVLSATPGGAADSFSSWDAVNQSAAAFALLQGVIPLTDAGLLAAVQAGGTFRVQARIGIRHGVGIDESAAREYLEGVLRVYRPGTSSYIGTIGTDTSETQALTDLSGTLANRALAGIAAGVPSAVATDILVVELGLQHDAPVTGGAGGSVWWNDTASTDLPEDESTTTNLRSWVELRTTGAATGQGRVEELTGTEPCAAHGDHAHHVLRDRVPEVTDDSEGYPAGTYWIVVDDVDDPTVILATYLSIDDSDDAAIWILQADPNPSGGTGSLTIEEEDGTPSGIFDTLKVPNDSLTDNGDGSASLDYALSVHSHVAPTDGFHGVLVQRTTDFTTTNSNSSIPDFDTQIYDTGGLWEGATNPDRITIPADWDGLMAVIEAWAGWDGSSDDYVEMKLYRNGESDEDNLISVTQHATNVGSPFQELHTPPIQVFEGDYFTLTLRTPTSQNAIEYHAASILFGAHLVGTPGPEGPEGPPGSSGTGGQHILLADGRSTPFAFNDMLQADDGSDFLWTDG